MKKIIGKLVLAIFRWKTSVDTTDEIKKYVMIAAPHTSNWDFIFAMMAFWKHDIKLKFFIKNSYTNRFIIGFIIRKMGAIGVDRSKKGKNLVNFAIQILENSDEIVILVPAEGSRKYVEKWKTGFYHIAKGANVPIALGFLNFKEKIAGVGPIIQITDNQEEDFIKIQNYYENIPGKHPELYNKKIFNQDSKL